MHVIEIKEVRGMVSGLKRKIWLCVPGKTPCLGHKGVRCRVLPFETLQGVLERDSSLESLSVSC